MANQTNQERLIAVKAEMDMLKRTIDLHEEGIKECEKRLDRLYDLQDDIRNDISAEEAGLPFAEWHKREFGQPVGKRQRSSDLNDVLREILGLGVKQ